MTDTNIDTQSISPEPEVNAVPKKPSRLLFVLAIVSIALSLGVAVAGYYVYKVNLSTYKQQTQQLNSQVNSQATVQNTQFEQAQVMSDEIKTKIEALNLQLLDIQNKNKLYSSDVQSLQRSVAETNVRHPNDWILSEVEYLINLSGRKLWLEHDLMSTIALLKAADQRVIEMRDASLNPLRRALLEDINALEALPEYDVDSAVLKLSSLERRIDTLLISGLEVPDIEENKVDELSNSVSDWKSNLNKSWDAFIESFVIISHRDVAVEALLSPKQAWYLKENLRNNLAKAEFAIYREQQAAYDLALNNALQLVEQYFDMTDRSNQHFHEQIVALSEQKITFIYPDQFKSAPLLSRIIEQRLSKSLIIEKAE